MTMLKTFTGAGLAVAVTATSFAGDFKPASVSSDFGRLVPDGAWAVVYTPSMNHLVQELMPLARSIDPQAAQGLMMMPMMMQMIATSGEAKDGRPAPPAKFHLDKPMGLAIGPSNPETGQPAITVILSADDAGKIRVSGMGGGPSKVVHLSGTDYIALTTNTFTPGTSASALCDGMFAADISINIDQAAVVKAYGPMIDQGLQAMNMLMPLPAKPTPEQKQQAETQQRMMAYNMKQIQTFLDGFDVWNVGIDLEETQLDVLAQYTLTNGSVIPRIAGSSMQALAALCTHVAPNMPLQFVMNAGAISSMIDFDASSANIYPPATQAKMAELMPLFIKSMNNIRTGMAGGVSFGDGGMRVVEVMDSNDSAAMISSTKKAWTALASADLGFSLTKLPSSDGVGYDISIDSEKLITAFGAGAFAGMPNSGIDTSAQMKQIIETMLGGDSVQVHLMTKGDLVGVAMGNDKALADGVRELMAKGTKSSPLAEALDHAWAKPTWAMSLEMRSLASQILGLAKVMAGPARVMLPKTLPEGDPIVFDVVGSTNATADQIRVRTDIASWIKFVKQIQAMAAKQGPRSA